jgi:hypothetical protein
MAEVKERLSRLIDLAGETAPEKQRALAFELCELLTDWPKRYPHPMREPFEALLEKVFKRLDGTTRRVIAARLADQAGIALTLLNEIYFDIPLEARDSILKRNAESDEQIHAAVKPADEVKLIEAARRTRGHDFAEAFANFLGVAVSTAERILGDTTGNALAVACRGAGVKRATYSALALLIVTELRINPGARFEHLAAFDHIPLAGAQRLLAHWREQPEGNLPPGRGAYAA